MAYMLDLAAPHGTCRAGAGSAHSHWRTFRLTAIKPYTLQVLWDLLLAAGRHSEALRHIALVHEAVKAAFGAGSLEQRMMDVRLGMSIAGAAAQARLLVDGCRRALGLLRCRGLVFSRRGSTLVPPLLPLLPSRSLKRGPLPEHIRA